MNFLWAGACLFTGPLCLGTPTLVRGVRMQARMEGSSCFHRLIAASHLSRHVGGGHPDTSPGQRRKWQMQAVGGPSSPDDTTVLGQAPGCRSVSTARWGCHPQLTCATSKKKKPGRAPKSTGDGRKRREAIHTGQSHSACVRGMRHLLHPTRSARTPHRCQKHDQSTPSCTIESFRLQCGESPRHTTGCHGLKRRGKRHGIQAGCKGFQRALT